MKKMEMGRVCRTYGVEERCLQGVEGKTRRKEATRMAQALMGG
jgi:hypothetical protein